jgi:phosphoglycerol transferase
MATLIGCCGDVQTYFFSEANKGFTATNLGDPESWGRWSVGDQVIVKFDKTFPTEFIFTLNIRAVTESNKGEIISVRVGDQVFEFVGPNNGSMNSISSYDFEVKGLPAGTNTISIRIPKPKSPKELGLSEDTRMLGIAMHSVAFSPINKSFGCELVGGYW